MFVDRGTHNINCICVLQIIIAIDLSIPAYLKLHFWINRKLCKLN